MVKMMAARLPKFFVEKYDDSVWGVIDEHGLFGWRLFATRREATAFRRKMIALWRDRLLRPA
jgi:hypothetical protein